MATFTITEVDPESRRWSPADKPELVFVYNTVRFEGEQGRGIADMKRPLGSPEPVEGQVLDGYEIVTKGDKRELKKEGRAPKRNGGSYKPRSPGEQAEIRMAVAIKAAVELLGIEASVSADKLRAEGSTAQALLDPRIDYFYRKLTGVSEGL